VTVQPGVQPDQLTYCLVSGVVFPVKASSSHREVSGKPVYFCCEACANYFSQNRERVIALRGLSPSSSSSNSD
jgi:YHS domain-containing protein